MPKEHTHKLVLIREFTGSHRLYWCRDCGLIMEFFSMMTAHMIPEWSKKRLFEEDHKKLNKYTFVKEKPVPKSEKRLGKGLLDMKTKEPSLIAKLLNNE